MSLNKDEALKKIEAYEGDNVEIEIFTSEEHTTFLDNFKKDTVEKSIGDEISKVHSRYDDDLFQITGLRKEPSEKTYDFNKRIVNDLKTKAESAEGLEQKIEDLKGKSPDETLKRENADLLKQYNDLKTEHDDKVGEMQSKFKGTQIMGRLDAAMQGLKFKDSIPDTVRSTVINAAKVKLSESADMNEDILVFRDKEGIILKNRENSLEPYTAEEMIKTELKDILDTGRKIEGTGVKPKVEEKNGKKTIIMAIPDSVKSTTDLHEHLVKEGLTRNSEEYKLAWGKYSDGLTRQR